MIKEILIFLNFKNLIFNFLKKKKKHTYFLKKKKRITNYLILLLKIRKHFRAMFRITNSKLTAQPSRCKVILKYRSTISINDKPFPSSVVARRLHNCTFRSVGDFGVIAVNGAEIPEMLQHRYTGNEERGKRKNLRTVRF